MTAHAFNALAEFQIYYHQLAVRLDIKQPAAILAPLWLPTTLAGNLNARPRAREFFDIRLTTLA